MRKPPTGEPCAGKPPARFGGRGGRKPFPTLLAGGGFLEPRRLAEKALTAVLTPNAMMTATETMRWSLRTFT